MSRVVAFTAAAAAVGLACGARTDLGGESELATDAATSADCHAAVTVYGAPFFDAACNATTPPKDASTSDASADASSEGAPSADATTDVGIAPPYGAHFPPDPSLAPARSRRWDEQ